VVRAIMDAVGVRDILTKSLRSGNPHNLVRATFNAFDRMESPEQYAERLGADLEVVYSNYSVRKNPTAQA
jgi:small subunit ribosomal protein S5